MKQPATIGPELWRDATLRRTLRLAQNVCRKADYDVEIGRSVDPLPNHRDLTAQATNDVIHEYSRRTRLVLAKVCAALLAVNREIKLMYKVKEELDKWHEYTRNNLMLNDESVDLRTQRRPSEKDHDGADDLLNGERNQLKNQKKNLETQLKLVQQHLRELDGSRRSLFNVQRERSRVLDLCCHTIWINHPLNNAKVAKYKTETTGRKALCHDNKALEVDPQGPYSPECERVLANAKEVKERSEYLRGESRDLLRRTRLTQKEAHRVRKAAHVSVSDGIMQKVHETTNLKNHLTLGIGENRHGIQRSQRWFDASEMSRLRTLGPESSKWLTTRENLNRPLVRVFQRHPGNQVPEGRNLLKHAALLEKSMSTTSRDIGLLNLTKQRQKNDHRCKTLAAQVDSNIVRLRHRKFCSS